MCVVPFSLHMGSLMFTDFQNKRMSAVSVFTNRNLSTANQEINYRNEHARWITTEIFQR